MKFQKFGRKYELIKGSDVINDTVYLELNDITDGQNQTVLFGEKRNDGEYRLLSLAHKGKPVERPLLLRLEIVEEFIQELKKRL